MQYYPDPLRTGRLIDWVPVIRGDFDRAPDLRLTLDQALGRWPVPEANLKAILEAFVDVGFLTRRSDGAYRRRPSNDVECTA